jgi:hypothetical protein
MRHEFEDLGARGFFDDDVTDDDTWYEDLLAAEIDAEVEARVASERVLVRGAESDLHDDEFNCEARVASERVLVRGAESGLHDDEFNWVV